jgi:hypothetical protein
MKLTRIAVILLLIISSVSAIACDSSSHQEPTPTPAPTITPTHTSTPMPTSTSSMSDAIELISPAPGAVTSDNTPLFTWTSVTNATSYQIQVATDPYFDNMVMDRVLSVQAYEAENELANDAYFWRVKGTSSTVETPWSALGSFIVAARGN